jgi:hypothetical protein
MVQAFAISGKTGVFMDLDIELMNFLMLAKIRVKAAKR